MQLPCGFEWPAEDLDTAWPVGEEAPHRSAAVMEAF